MTDLALNEVAVETATPTVAVVVCCYTVKRWTQIVDALASIRAQTLPADEVILVVDHAPDLLERATVFEHVRVIPNDGERGLSGARNTGVAASQSDVVAFLDDDAAAEPDWLEQLASAYADPAVLGVGGHVEPAWEGDRPAWFPPEFDWVVGCSYPGLPAEGGAVRNFIGANMSFRRDVLDTIGGFRRDLGRVGRRPVGCEETELCIRASDGFPGGVLLHQPKARVRHQVPSDRQTWAYLRSRCFGEGVSKAVVARIAGRQAALSSERDYVRRVLPRGLRTGGRRALALVAGLAVTTTGYLVGRAAPQRRAALVLLGALVAWAVSLRSVDLDSMTDLGLVSVLPVAFWVALAVVIGAAVVSIHRGRNAAAQLVALIFIIHGTPELLYGTLRYSWAWKHIGIVDFIVRHGAVDPTIPTLNAYHAWPGFFALNAELTTATGVPTPSYAGWAPALNTVLALVPLWLIFDTLTRDRRRVWFGLLVFVLTNWIGQEYFSPQAFAFLLHLTVLAVCLRWLPARNGSSHSRRGLIAVIALLMLAIVSSHQLTPFMLLTALTLLVIARRIGPIWLPVLLAGLIVLWIYAMASQFLGQNLYWIVESIGKPASNTQTTFVDLSQAGEEQHLVAWADRGLTAGMWLLGLAGAFRLRRTKAPYGITGLLAVSPLPLLAANSYGGEMLFRVYLFALPFLALLVAGFIYPRPTTGPWSLPAAMICVLVMATAFSLAYYGKERANRFTTDEVAASAWLYQHAPRNAVLLSATANYPWAFTHYEYYRYEFMENLPPAERRQLSSNPVPVLSKLGGTTEPVYVVLTRSEQVSVRYTGVLPAGAWARISTDLAKNPDYRLAFRNDDAAIYLHAPKASR
jgi:glycosyltransferase involved in cell wall biosynthesis